MRPPSAGPTIALTPHTLLKTPCIRARCRGSKISPTIVKAMGCTAPAPRPWIARKMMSCSMLAERPHSIDPPTNSPSPARKSGFRPRVSARVEKIGTVVVAVSRYAAKTQPYSPMPPSCPMIVGIAVPTTVESSAATAMPAMTPAVTSSCCRVIGASSRGMPPSLAAGRGGPPITTHWILTGDAPAGRIAASAAGGEDGPLRCRALDRGLPEGLGER